jgi:hypothetical protein
MGLFDFNSTTTEQHWHSTMNMLFAIPFAGSRDQYQGQGRATGQDPFFPHAILLERTKPENLLCTLPERQGINGSGKFA